MVSEHERAEHTTAMVAFFVPDEISGDLVIDHPNAERAEELHVTLAFLGEASEVDKDALIDAVTEFARGQSPVTAYLSGLVRFTATDGDDAICYLVQSDEIGGFRNGLLAHLAMVEIEPANKRNFVPHITVAYVRGEENTPQIEVPDIEMTFSSIHIAYGDERFEIPLTAVSDEEDGSELRTAVQEIFDGEKPMSGFLRAQPAVKANQRKRLLDDPTLPVPWVASTPGRKSDGFNLRAEDWDLKRYLSYPVVLYGHDFRGTQALPVGLGEDVRVDGGIKMNVVYDTDDPFAMRIRAKAIKGMIAGSVSWDRNKETGKNELLEFSMVNLGVDPDALPEIERMAMRSMMDDMMDDMGGKRPADLTKAIDALREKVHEVMENFADEAETREADPEEGGEEVVQEAKRALDSWDVLDQIYPIIRERVADWFHLMGPFFEGDVRFVVAVVDGRYWRYDFSMNDADEIEVAEGYRVRMEFNPIAETERGMSTDDEEDRMDMEDEEERADTEDNTVTEDDEPEVTDDELLNDDENKRLLEAIFAKVDGVSRNLTQEVTNE